MPPSIIIKVLDFKLLYEMNSIIFYSYLLNPFQEIKLNGETMLRPHETKPADVKVKIPRVALSHPVLSCQPQTKKPFLAYGSHSRYTNFYLSIFVVYFDQRTHACACLRMVENNQKHKKMIKKYIFLHAYERLT